MLVLLLKFSDSCSFFFYFISLSQCFALARRVHLFTFAFILTLALSWSSEQNVDVVSGFVAGALGVSMRRELYTVNGVLHSVVYSLFFFFQQSLLIIANWFICG